jgi:outer membrane protein
VIRNILIITTLITLVIASGTPADAQKATQGIKLGYVNSAKILSEYPEAQDAQKKIDATGKRWQNELEQLSKEFQDKYEEFQKKEATLNEQSKRDQREQLLVLEQKGMQYRQQKFGTGGELEALTDSLLTPLKKRVLKVIESIAKQEKIQFIFDRNDQILVLLYGESQYDYTNLVIDRLKRGKSDN